ncbi:MAG: virulence protein SciE type [Rhodobacteraceae bacterium]|nr:virulence protein SciE type [Paracoccaceae bacterium]
MSAEEIIKTGNLAETLDALTANVRKDPSNTKHRIFLFQLFCVLGEWKRAVTQLKVIGEMDPITLPMVQSYREAIICELVREKVFIAEKTPMIFGEPEAWVAGLIQALEPLSRGDTATAAKLREAAFDKAPTSSGTADGEKFEWIADADMRLGPILEVVVNGNYYWVPFSSIKKLKMEEPVDLRDNVWTPVQITWINGGEVVGFIPTRYPGAPASDNDQVKLAKITEWNDLGDETFIGSGQRLFATDAGDLPLMDIREIIFDTEMQIDDPIVDEDEDSAESTNG